MKKTISLLSIDKLTKGQVLTNRKDFKKDINTLRTTINDYRSEFKGNPFMNIANGKNVILDIVDDIIIKYNVSQETIRQILQLSHILSAWRKECNRTLKHSSDKTLLKDRLVALGMIKAGMTQLEVSKIYKVHPTTVSAWVRNDREFGLHLDKAIAFRHDTI